MTDKQTLAERLEAALALVSLAVERPWCVVDGPSIVHDPDVNVYRGHIADFVERDDAAATAAVINLLRDHGDAILQVVRAVEGAARITAEGREFALVPLDAAGRAETKP